MKGYHGATNETPLELPAELSWAGTDRVIGRTVAFVAAEAELMAWTHIPDTITPYMRYWVSRWDGGMAPSVSRETWLGPAVNGWINVSMAVAFAVGALREEGQRGWGGGGGGDALPPDSRGA